MCQFICYVKLSWINSIISWICTALLIYLHLCSPASKNIIYASMIVHVSYISFHINFCVHKMSYVSSYSLWNDRQNVSKYRIKSKVYIKMINQGIHNFNPVSFTIYHIKDKHNFFIIIIIIKLHELVYS